MNVFNIALYMYFYPRDAILAWVFARAMCPSVCYFTTKKDSVMISSLSGISNFLVPSFIPTFWRVNVSTNTV